MKLKSFDALKANQDRVLSEQVAKANKAANLKNSLSQTYDKMFYGFESLLKNNPITNFLNGKGFAIMDEDTYEIYLRIEKSPEKGLTSTYTYSLYKNDKKTGITIDTYDYKKPNSEFKSWDVTELRRFLTADEVSDIEVEKIIYLGITTIGSEKIGTTLEFKSIVSNEASTGINLAPVSNIVNGSTSTDIPANATGAEGLCSFTEMVSSLKERCKYIIDEIMKLNKFRQDLNYTIDKAYENFDNEEVAIHEFEKVETTADIMPDGTPVTKTIYTPRYTVTIARSVPVSECNGFPIPIQTTVQLGRSFTEDGVESEGFQDVDLQGNAIDLDKGTDYLTFLYTRFGNSLSPTTIAQVISEEASNASSGGLLGGLGKIAIGIGAIAVSDFLSDKVDEYEAKAAASVADRLDNYKVNEVTKGFLASDKVGNVLQDSKVDGIIKNKNQLLKYYEINKKETATDTTADNRLRVITNSDVVISYNEYADVIVDIFSIDGKVVLIQKKLISEKKFTSTESENLYNEYIKNGTTIIPEMNLYQEVGKSSYTIKIVNPDGDVELIPAIIDETDTMKYGQFDSNSIFMIINNKIFLIYSDKYFIINQPNNDTVVDMTYISSNLTFNYAILSVKVDDVIRYKLCRFYFNKSADIEYYPDIRSSLCNFNDILPAEVGLIDDYLLTEKNSIIYQINSTDMCIVYFDGTDLKVYQFKTEDFINFDKTDKIDVIDKSTLITPENTEFLLKLFNKEVKMISVNTLDKLKCIMFDTNGYIIFSENNITYTNIVPLNCKCMNVDSFGNINSYDNASYNESIFTRVGDIYLVGDRQANNRYAKYTFIKDKSTNTNPNALTSDNEFVDKNNNKKTSFGEVVDTKASVDASDIVNQKINSVAKSTSIRIDVTLSSLTQASSEPSLAIDYTIAKKAKDIKSAVTRHRDFIIDVYKKLLSMEKKANSLPNSINPYLITQYSKMKK